MLVEGMFDITAENKSVTEIPLNIPDLNDRDWNIGLIVGPSGAGKTTVAKTLFNQELLNGENLVWDATKSLIDDFPATMSIQDITTLLSSVGFSSPPAWLRPFHTLSNGEQFRVTMARILAEQPDLSVVDEFTSVVDRTVAQVGSYAIAKTVRKRGQKLVAVTCHYDVQEWLQPDWIYEPATGKFSWELLRQRPPIELEFVRTTREAWAQFSRYHYLDHTVNSAALIICVLVNKRPAALIATKHFPHPKNPNIKSVSRIVVMPDFQGLGLGAIILDLVGGAYKFMGKQLNIVTSHPAFVRSLNRSKTWAMTRKPSRVGVIGKSSTINALKQSSSGNRITATFQYVGPANAKLADLLRNDLQ
jgi:ABC-type lipoprotein export system ATPase subunit